MFTPAMEERGQHPHDFPSAHPMLAASMGALFRPPPERSNQRPHLRRLSSRAKVGRFSHDIRKRAERA